MNYNLPPPNSSIPVYGEEAEIVRNAQQALTAAAERTAQAEREGKVLPMIFFDREREKPALDAYQELQIKIRDEQHLAYTPHLFAAVTPTPPHPVTGIQTTGPLFHSMKVPRITEMELAKIFLQRLFIRRVGQTVYCYNGKYYRQINDDELKTLILDQMRSELGIKGSSAQLKNIVEFVKAEPEIEVKQPNGFKRFLCLHNGVLDLANFTLYPHSPQYFVTWQMQTEWIPDSVCPVCDRFVYEIAGGNPMLIQRIWETIGYILVPLFTGTKRFVLLQGKGDTGKSVLGNLLRSFYAPEDVGGLDAFKFGERFSNGYLVDKRINLAMDLNDGCLTTDAVSAIKSITESDLLPIERKYGHMYSAVIECVLIFGTNHTLRITSQDEALMNRILFIPFLYPVPKERQDHTLLSKLVAERPGILYKAFQYYKGVMERNFIFTGDDYYDFRKVSQSGDQTANELEDLQNFVNLHCVAVLDNFTPTDMIHTYYLQYCQSIQHEGIQNDQKFSSRFKHMLESDPRFESVVNKKQRYGGKPVNGYLGIALQ